MACIVGNLQVVKTLIGAGADHLHVNMYDKDALAIAVEKGHLDIVRYLLDLINPTKLNLNTGIIRALAYSRNLEMRELVMQYIPAIVSFIVKSESSDRKKSFN